MIRIIGCSMLMMTGTLIGFFTADKLNHNLKADEIVYRLFLEIRVMLDCTYMTLEEIISRLKQESEFACCEFLNVDTDEPNLKNMLIRKINSSTYLTAGSKSILSDFFMKFGTTDINGQLSYINLTIVQTEGMLNSEKNNVLKKSRLYKSLGVLGGAFSAIILM